MKNKVLLIFPHQLFEHHELIDQHATIFLIEDTRFFGDFLFHKQKLIFHRATMRAYASSLEKNGKNVFYVEHTECKSGLSFVFNYLKKRSVDQADYFDVIDHELEKKIVQASRQAGIVCRQYDSPSFFLTRNEVSSYFSKKNRYAMAPFYQFMRKKFSVLLIHGKPIGGRWSFDEDNRERFNDALSVPAIPKNNRLAHVAQARTYIEKYFANNPGDTKTFIYPVTHEQARIWFTDFLAKKLHNFGTYQDAIHKAHPFGFHSLLSPLLNAGLLLPQYVVVEAIKYAQSHKIAINQLEGFVRQILGWREFVRGVYVVNGDKQRGKNIFHHKNMLPKSFWTATTGLEPLDDIIRNVLKYAYAHHIERLMVLGNFMLLTATSPDEVYTWFMEMFIDAYDWVMVPNVYGMSQYADGGMMTTKPYCSSSAYIKRMSNYGSGDWVRIWDGLYWNFIYHNRVLLGENMRMKFVISALRKMHAKKLEDHLEIAHRYIKAVNKK